MHVQRRDQKLTLANNCAGERFPLHLGFRCAKHRWNNPRLFSRGRTIKRVFRPDFVDAMIDDNPVKRVYRGFLTPSRFSRLDVSTRPTVSKGMSFRQSFARVRTEVES